MNVERMLGGLIGSALGARPKRHRRTANFLMGGGRHSFLNASTLLSAAGLAWGAYEVYRTSGAGAGSSTTVVRDDAPVSTTTIVSDDAPPLRAPPPLPPSVAATSTRDASVGDASTRAGNASALPEGARRLLLLAIAAAKSDGTLDEEEYGKILAVAREHGVEALVAGELKSSRPLTEIVTGANEPQHKADLYALAFSIVRADEDLSGPERIWLARLASLLGFDRATVERIERETVKRINSADA